MIYPDAESFLAALDTLDRERGDCRNCQRTFDGCINANGDHWLPCCFRCDHP